MCEWVLSGDEEGLGVAGLFAGEFGEEGGEVEVDGGVGDGELGGVDLEQASGGVGVGDALAGVDDPEVLDAHAEVVFHDLNSAGEAVFGREDFDAEKRWGFGDLFNWRVGEDGTDIGDADAGVGYTDALLCDGDNLPLFFVIRKPCSDQDLDAIVIEFAQVAPLGLAVNEVAVGAVVGVEVALECSESWGCCRHGNLAEELTRV